MSATGDRPLHTATSRDGTTIAFERIGGGPPLILVGGIFEQRAMDSETAQLAASPLLAEHFTVVHYDRRGRGQSTDTPPYALQREIEDIAALIDVVGGHSFLFGISSGAALAFEAALALGEQVQKLALYEPPYNDDVMAREAWRAFRTRLRDVLAEGRHGDAVALFMGLMGVPADQLDELRQAPMWPLWEAVAPTIAYDAAALGEDSAVPAARATRLTAPTLVVAGGASYPWIQISAATLARAIPGARHCLLEGQTHEVTAEALAPVLVQFFAGSPATR